MGTLGLVHGGGLGAWCWEMLLPELEKRGLHAATVDLPFEDQSAGAARFAEAVLDAFAGIEDLVLVGHSFAGLITPLVAARRPVQRLIFIHSLLPRPGLSVADQLAAEPDLFNPDMLATQGPWWEEEAIATRFLFHDCPAEVAHRAFARLRPMESQLAMTEVTPLEAWPGVPCAYILCTDDRTATPAWARRAARERLGVDPIEIPGGHCPFLSRPRQLAEVLERCL
ncbi:MAG: alpha/beta hydrolase [Isosphaeraceae bacterium]|nr:alpha/beta hydrolase [Isosphaeraceae bacterium]